MPAGYTLDGSVVVSFFAGNEPKSLYPVVRDGAIRIDSESVAEALTSGEHESSPTKDHAFPVQEGFVDLWKLIAWAESKGSDEEPLAEDMVAALTSPSALRYMYGMLRAEWCRERRTTEEERAVERAQKAADDVNASLLRRENTAMKKIIMALAEEGRISRAMMNIAFMDADDVTHESLASIVSDYDDEDGYRPKPTQRRETNEQSKCAV